MTLFIELLIGAGVLGAGIGSVIGRALGNIIASRNQAQEVPIIPRRRRGAVSSPRRKRPNVDRQSLLMNLVSDDTKCLTNEDIELEDECVICLEPFSENDIIRELGCSHFFHVECINDWETKSNTCPCCRETF